MKLHICSIAKLRKLKPWFRKNWILANPKKQSAALGKMPGSEGNHSQNAPVMKVVLSTKE